MASQITHIVYAEKIRKKLLKGRQLNKKKYFIGNVFPDIRYLGAISREETHSKNPLVENLDSITSSFKLGMYVHALVDWEREKTLSRLGMYSLVEKDPITSTALKLLEDEVTYSLYDQWSKTALYFDQVLGEETALVPENVVVKWHQLVKDYFLKKKETVELIEEIGFDKKNAEIVINKMDFLKKNSEVLSIIMETFGEII